MLNDRVHHQSLRPSQLPVHGLCLCVKVALHSRIREHYKGTLGSWSRMLETTLKMHTLFYLDVSKVVHRSRALSLASATSQHRLLVFFSVVAVL